jgi:hypothetical protein
MFIHPQIPLPQQTDGFLFKLLLSQLSGVGKSIPIIYPLISFILLYTQAITLNALVNQHRLMQKPNYLTGMAYLLITSLFAEWNILSAPLIINSLIIWVWSRMSKLYNEPSPKASLFNIGMAIGISCFFYFPTISFSVMVVVGLLITRPFKLPEWVVALLGLASPFYFLLAYVYVMDKWQGYHFPGVAVTLPHFIESRWALTAVIIVLFTTIVGFIYVQKNFRRQLVQARKSWNLIFLYLLIALFIPFINASHSFVYWILSAVPIAVIAGASFLYPQKKAFPLILHWLMVAFAIAFSYFVQ